MIVEKLNVLESFMLPFFLDKWLMDEEDCWEIASWDGFAGLFKYLMRKRTFWLVLGSAKVCIGKAPKTRHNKHV